LRILLSTYNYYPANKGGTEVYVSQLIARAKTLGHEIGIVAAADPWVVTEKGVEITPLLSAEDFTAFTYKWEGTPVLGISLVEKDMLTVHQKWAARWQAAIAQALEQTGWQKPDMLWMHGLNGVSGLSLLKALQQWQPSLPVYIWLHTPFSCFKGTLLRPDIKLCTVLPGTITCSNCFLAGRIPAGGMVVGLLDMLPGFMQSLLPQKVRKLPNYVAAHLNVMAELEKAAHGWFCFTETMRPHLLKTGLTASKIHFIPHGIDTDVFHASGRTTAAHVRFLYSGRWQTVKGFDILARAWLQLPDMPKIRRLAIAGTPPVEGLEKKLIPLVKALEKRKDTDWLGHLPPAALAETYRSSDVVLIPSKWVETGPLVFHEAAASGCYVVASDIGGNTSLAALYPAASILVKPASAAALKKAITREWKLPAKPQAAQSMGYHFDKLLSFIYPE
jgi:glycosyltransferase involved in cell wall biosynthesis